MKKVVLITATILVILYILWSFFFVAEHASDEVTISKARISKEVETKVKSQVTKSGTKPSEGTKQADPEDFKDSSGCINDPNFLSVFKRLDALGIGQANLVGRGHYQELNLSSLASYADAGEPDAMFLYGLELVWKGLFGMYQTKHYREHPVGSTSFKESLKNHKVDLSKVREGEKYLFKSAVQGKLLALGEIAAYFAISVKSLKKQEESEDQIKRYLVESHAYTLLMKDVFKNDYSLLESLTIDNKSLDTTLKIAFPDGVPQGVEADLINKAQNRFKELKEKWRSSREYFGYDVYPDLFTTDEEELYITCS
ncbi:hypothetical protein [Kangiella taiwanensis]|uniref:hypothetical protein n=1 Tax=Kangiella taiwanensis TaxID=1079179 RepID=UPI001CBB933B|nr:hypothetical protein [Kangiella taiwanensis]